MPLLETALPASFPAAPAGYALRREHKRFPRGSFPFAIITPLSSLLFRKAAALRA